MLVFKTSAADVGKWLLLSEVNHYSTRLVLISLRYTPIWGAGGGRCVLSMRTENKKGWNFLITNKK
jgi:hypothetical protein